MMLAAAALLLTLALLLILGPPVWRGELSPAVSSDAASVAQERAPAIIDRAARQQTPRASRAEPAAPHSARRELDRATRPTVFEDLINALRALDLRAAKALLFDIEDQHAAAAALSKLVFGSIDLAEQLMAVQMLASIEGGAAAAALVRAAEALELALQVRTQAVIGLGAQSGNSGQADLVEFLYAIDPEIRVAAYRALGLLADSNAVQPLVDALWYEEVDGVRRAAYEALAQVGTSGALEGLLAIFRSDSSRAAVDRPAILAAIAVLSTAEAVPGLLDALYRAEEPELRAALILGLGASADPRAFDVLLDTVETGQAGESRLQAINGLGLIGDPRALPALELLEEQGDVAESRYSRTAIERILAAS
jgi:HEAT repeat protein